MKKIGIILSVLALVSSTAIAQETTFKVKNQKGKEKGERIEIKVKEGEANPVIIIDSKEYDFEILNIIDKNKIESVTVLKGEDALKKYDAKNGVILIKTKQKDDNKVEVLTGSNKENSSTDNNKRVKIDVPEGTDAPIIIIDGVIKDRDVLDNISPDDIESIKVLKDDDAKKKYNTEAGVIIIKTKKK